MLAGGGEAPADLRSEPGAREPGMGTASPSGPSTSEDGLVCRSCLSCAFWSTTCTSLAPLVLGGRGDGRLERCWAFQPAACF